MSDYNCAVNLTEVLDYATDLSRGFKYGGKVKLPWDLTVEYHHFTMVVPIPSLSIVEELYFEDTEALALKYITYIRDSSIIAVDQFIEREFTD